MRENIQKHDRILFIASKYSIKSEACQFELSEGCRKQKELWTEIIFPIHIDNYLFEVNKDDIRRLDKQDEYWGNICELRKINSIDFSEFNDREYSNNKFEKKVFNLIKDLRK